MNETVYEGETLEEALSKAGEALGLAPEGLEYEVTEERDGGFWGLDESFVRLRAWPRPQDDGPSEAETDIAAAEEEENPDPPSATPEEETQSVPTPSAPPLITETTVSEEPAGAESRGFWDSFGADDKNNNVAGGKPAEEADLADVEEAAGPHRDDASPAGDVGTTDDSSSSVAAETPAAEKTPAADELRVDEEPTEEKTAELPASAIAAEDRAGDAAGEADGDASAEIEALTKKILAGMDFSCTMDVQTEAEVYMVMIGGADKELLLEGNGRPLSALELILNHAFRHRLTERRKIRVDAGDFRSQREEELRDLAFQVAHSAKETERTQETQPLNPYERRLVHLALAEDSRVTTRSRGSGFLKNVQVIPRRSGRGDR